ncbi:hypothetical protein JZ751_004308, partial [Albula glossodonta]
MFRTLRWGTFRCAVILESCRVAVVIDAYSTMDSDSLSYRSARLRRIRDQPRFDHSQTDVKMIHMEVEVGKRKRGRKEDREGEKENGGKTPPQPDYNYKSGTAQYQLHPEKK